MKPTIYKPSIYKGAGIYNTGAEGGEENPDGSLRCTGIMNNNTRHFLNIPVALNNGMMFEFTCMLGGGIGLFGIVKGGSGAYYTRTRLGLRNDNRYVWGNYPGNASADYSFSGAVNGAKLTYKLCYPGSDMNLELYVNEQLVTTVSHTHFDGELSADKLFIFRCFDDANDPANCGTFLFMGLKISSHDETELYYNFTPAEKEGIAGVYEEVTGIFYGEPYHDNSIVALK